MNTGVYKIKNISNNKFYIGSTASLGFVKRWNCHRNQLRVNKHPNPYLQHAWNKYGEQNFKFEIIEECSPSNCIIREQYYFGVLSPQYNILQTAGSMLGYQHSSLAKQKIGNASRGKNHPMYLGEFTFYHPEYGYFTGGLVEFSIKFGFQKTLGHKLKTGVLSKSHGWIYIGKYGVSLPEDINSFYYNRIHNNRPIYSFYHKYVGIFVGTIPDFMQKNNIHHQNQSTISSLIKRKRKMAWGWIFVGEGKHQYNETVEKMYINALKQNSKANSTINIIYTFSHPINGEYVGTKKKFSENFGLNYPCINHLESGKLKTYKKWYIKS